MRRLTSAVVALAAVFATTLAPIGVAAQDSMRVFTRTGQWQLDAAEGECRLARAFSNGSEQIALALERNRAENQVRLVLVTDVLSAFRGADQIGYRFLPSTEQRSARYIRADMEAGQEYFNLGTVIMGQPVFPGPDGVMPLYDRAAELEFAAGITAIEINQGLTSPLRLETGSLRAAMVALQTCTDDLLLSWGIDWEMHQTMTRRAAPDGAAHEWIPAGTLAFGDFPSLSAGRNPFRVMVNAEGQPTACVAHWASLSAEKNQRVCDAILRNGKFLPALDATGQPMASYWMVDYFLGLAGPPPGR
jgi:hypothetical protein